MNFNKEKVFEVAAKVFGYTLFVSFVLLCIATYLFAVSGLGAVAFNAFTQGGFFGILGGIFLTLTDLCVAAGLPLLVMYMYEEHML